MCELVSKYLTRRQTTVLPILVKNLKTIIDGLQVLRFETDFIGSIYVCKILSLCDVFIVIIDISTGNKEMDV